MSGSIGINSPSIVTSLESISLHHEAMGLLIGEFFRAQGMDDSVTDSTPADSSFTRTVISEPKLFEKKQNMWLFGIGV
jgi:hypothetical protein